jgi:hypothetical protein
MLKQIARAMRAERERMNLSFMSGGASLIATSIEISEAVSPGEGYAAAR